MLPSLRDPARAARRAGDESSGSGVRLGIRVGAGGAGQMVEFNEM